MTDPTEGIRRTMVAALNAQKSDRQVLEEHYGQVWNGGAHGRPVGITRDMDKLNVATKNGWNTLQFETKMVKNLDDDGLSQAVKTTKETLINNQSIKQEQ